MKLERIVKACVFGGLVLISILAGVAYAQQPVPVKVITSGSSGSDVLAWTLTAFTVPIGGFLTGWLIRLMNNAGIVGADLLKNQLQSMVVNALNAGVALAGHGKSAAEIKNSALAYAISYVQQNGATILKRLGEDPSSAKVAAVIRARAETAIVDPNTPTHPVLEAATTAASGSGAWPPATATTA